MRYLNWLLVFLCISYSLKAQITAAEYFIDTDPGVGNGTTLSISGNEIDQNLSISTNGLSEGIHKLYVRIINTDGAWSLYGKCVFYVNPSQTNASEIASAEYFFDVDPGVGNGSSIGMSGSEIDSNFNVPTNTLSDGVHKLYVRIINGNGSWSLYDKNVIYVSPNNSNTSEIASTEYFIDSDPGVGNGITLNVSGNSIDEELSIPTNSLSDGVHKLYLRVLNTNGLWSLYDKNIFYVDPSNINDAPIVAAEYFMDTDPGLGNGNALSVSGDAINENFNISTVGLVDGIHKLYVRLFNEDGSWSLYDKGVFYIDESITNSALINEAEYFFDIDPGIGNGTVINFSQTQNLDSDFEVEVPNDLPSGDHIMYVRVKNENNIWSLYAYSEPDPLSLNDEVLRTFRFHPNPVKDILYFNTNKQTIRNVKVIDLTGKIVYETMPNDFKINLNHLETGTYLVYLKTDLGSVSKKILKQ